MSARCPLVRCWRRRFGLSRWCFHHTLAILAGQPVPRCRTRHTHLTPEAQP